jgi:hypothetical protein
MYYNKLLLCGDETTRRRLAPIRPSRPHFKLRHYALDPPNQIGGSPQHFYVKELCSYPVTENLAHSQLGISTELCPKVGHSL